MEQWKIHKDRARCDEPGCPLAAEQEYYAVLQLPECLRIERCQKCFLELKQSTDALPFHWKVRRTRGGATQATLDLQSLRVLFDKLGEAVSDDEEVVEESMGDTTGTDDPEEVAPVADVAGLRYLVALLLLRKRRLKLVDPRNAEEEKADLLVVDPKIEGMEPVALCAPVLDSDRLAGLRDELMAAIGT